MKFSLYRVALACLIGDFGSALVGVLGSEANSARRLMVQTVDHVLFTIFVILISYQLICDIVDRKNKADAPDDGHGEQTG